jgi:uncharacterized membrane protein (DUF2068 family)
MTTLDHEPIGSTDVELDFQLEVLTDASRVAAEYWKNHLWVRAHQAYRPGDALFAKFGVKYGVGGIEEAWKSWFEILTGDDYFMVLTGVDMERIGDGYGSSPRRT